MGGRGSVRVPKCMRVFVCVRVHVFVCVSGWACELSRSGSGDESVEECNIPVIV
jgi:hypothetical protein